MEQTQISVHGYDMTDGPLLGGSYKGFMGEQPYRGLRPISGALTLKENGRSLTKMNERPVAPNDTNRRSAGSVQLAHMVSVGVTKRPIWKRPRTSTNPKAPAGVVRSSAMVSIDFNPGPDAQDRLRRLFSLLVKYATEDKLPAPDADSSSEDGSEVEA